MNLYYFSSQLRQYWSLPQPDLETNQGTHPGDHQGYPISDHVLYGGRRRAVGDRPLRVRSSQVRHLRGLRFAGDRRPDAASLGLQEAKGCSAENDDDAIGHRAGDDLIKLLFCLADIEIKFVSLALNSKLVENLSSLASFLKIVACYQL
jgi:hypothetical protein